MKQKGKYVLATILTVLGLLTLFLSSSVIFDCCGIREKEGDYVLSVVWANFIAAFLYLFSAFGLIKHKKWYLKTMLLAVGVLITGQILFFIHVVEGGLYETKTVGAMIFRIAFTVILTIFGFWLKPKESEDKK